MPAELIDVIPLVGYMDEPYTKRFLSRRCTLPEGRTDVGLLIRQGRAAAALRGARDAEAEVLELADGPILSRVRGDERIKAVVKGRPWSLAQVEIDGLVSLQKYVNSTYADAIARDLDLGGLDERLSFCLTDAYAPRVSELFEGAGGGVFAIKSGGSDLRVVDSSATREPRTGATKVSFTVGWGHPFVVVAKLKGRYVLNNGYHRAFALRKRGVRHLPCLLVDVESYADLECAGPPALFGPDSILGTLPPRFSAFFDSDISPTVKMRHSSTAVVIRPTVTTLDADAMEGYFSSQEQVRDESPSAGLEYVDVKPTFEDWSVYRLDDGTLLNLRAVVTRARRRADGTLGEAVVSDPIWVTNPPKGAKGARTPAAHSAEELNAAIVRRDIGFATIREPVNEYVTERGEQILLTLRLVSIAKTSKFDGNGDAIYVFSTTRDVNLA